ncbi:GNAT family N-acetyltransferase [Oceanobacillus sp. CAU 1775]
MEIKIVKYDESYAARVADMWNHSREGWGGANTVDTEETILCREASSTNIHTYLALEADTVVGYCGLSEYREDAGALYIPLLNVRDDYHGKKIGKKLLLTALEETIDLQWPRLDLYTWPGNTKAVPLYKKCGFFWEDRDDTTHLMNFMPTVFQTEAFQDFFKEADWYADSTRKIEVKPDGRVENDFHFYEYSWEKADKMLRVEFERTSRGIRLIETEDYYISATIPEHQLVFGEDYKINYKVKNKTGKPLYIEFSGKNDKNIEFSFAEAVEVKDWANVEGTFFVGQIDEEQNIDRTHPSVQTDIKINGKHASFKVGVLPKFPAQVSATIIEDLSFNGKESTFYLDVMNNFSGSVQFEMEFPASDLLKMENPKLQIELTAKEKQSIAIPFTVHGFGYYDAKLNIKARKENGEIIHFTKQIGIPLRGIGSKFYGENEKSIQLYNGQYFAELTKQGNEIQMGRKKKESQLEMMTPKIGKPYSEELTRAKWQEKAFFEDTGYIGAKVTYQLDAFPDLKLHMIMKLYSEGLVESYYEVENSSGEQTANPVWVNQPIYLYLEQAILPYRNQILELNDSIGNSYDYWNDKKLSENWIFINNKQNPVGIAWNKADNIHFGSWFNYFEHDLGKIDAHSSRKTNAIFFSIGAFHDVDSFREFATQATLDEKEKRVNHLRLSLDNQNPFVKGDKLLAQVTDYKSHYLHGELKLSLPSNTDEVAGQAFNREEEKTEWKTEVDLGDASLISTIKLKAQLDATVQERETLVIGQTDTTILEDVVQEAGLDVWKVNNGVIELKTAPDFYPALHSLTYKGQEWLDTSFPNLEPKLWWNPWSGGLSSRLSETRTHSIAKEKTTAGFVKLADNKGNNWNGIKLTTTILENDKLKGFTYHQYFLLLPGAPILCHVSEIEQSTGTFFNGKDWQTTTFFKPAEEISENWLNIQDQSGEWTKVVAGKDENDVEVARNFIVGSDKQKNHIQVIANTVNAERAAYVNTEVLMTAISEQLTMASGSSKFTTPNFYLFNNKVIHDLAQHDLQEIRFE